MENTLADFAGTIVIAAIVIGFIGVISVHMYANDNAYDAYTKCVQTEYHTTPAQWYAEHQELPECDN